jgi:hypothetical protein
MDDICLLNSRMSGKYVPPHLRGKTGRPVSPKRGVRFPSNATGEESANVRYKKAPTSFRNRNMSRSEKYVAISRRLATRRLRSKPVKSVLKKGKTKRLVKSA